MVHGYLSLGILIISFFSIYLSFLLLKQASGIIKIPFIATFFWFKYIIFAYIGSVSLNIIAPQYEIVMGVYERKDLLLNVWYYTTAGLFLIPLGMFIANWATRYNPQYYTQKLLSSNIEINKRDRSKLMYFIVSSLFLLSIIVLFVYIQKINYNVPILGLLDGLQASDLALFRSDATNNFDGKYYRYELFMKTLPLLLLLISFFLKNKSFKWKLLFLLLLGYNIFVNIMDIQKAPVIKLFLLLMLAYFYYKNKISRKIFISVGLVSITFILLMYIFFMGMTDVSLVDIFSSIFHRIFVGSIIAAYWVQLFQEHFGYIYGLSFPNPAHIFPFEHMRITVELQNFVHPELIELGITGSAPTVFFAEWFINFGPFIALFSMILLGFILQFLDIYFIKKLSKHKDILISVLFIYLISYFGKFAETSYVGIFVDTSWIIPTFIILSIILFRNTILKYRSK